MPKICYSKEIEIKRDVDVFIAGGGPAGCAAAVAAARLGVSVFLAESQAFLGGQGTAGLVPAFMQFGDGENFLAAGIGKEFFDKLQVYKKQEGQTGNSCSIKLEALKRLYEDTLVEAGVEFSYHLTLIDVVTHNNQIEYCVVNGKNGIYAVRAKIYIDCTGDADLSYMAGAPFNKGDESGNMMAGTLCSLWTGIDWSKKDGPDNRYLKDAIDAGVFKNPDLHLPGMWKISELIGGGNIGHTFGVDGTDEESLTLALLKGRKLYDQYEHYYKAYLKGYENMELVATGSMLGIRETRRIVGEYCLCIQDFIKRAVFEDEIGRYCYPVDIHASDSSSKSFDKFLNEHTSYRYEKGESYGVPYRILVPKLIENLLVAGRCVSTDRPMQSSIRVMPGCYITGQAAGTAAAICVKDSAIPRTINVKMIQSALKSAKMYLPNFRD